MGKLKTGKQLSQTITITNVSGATIPQPIRVTLIGSLAPGILAANAAGPSPDGGLRQGAFWNIGSSLLPGGSAQLTLVFNNPMGKTNLFYGLAIQDGGSSEAVASIQAYKALVSANASNQSDLINFLRVQVINGKVGEGSGGVQGKPGVVP